MDKFKKLISRPLIKKSAVIVFLLLITDAGVLIFHWSKLPPEVPLYYSLPWGEQRLVSAYGLLILPILGLGIYLFNCLLAVLLARENQLLTKILVYTAIFVNTMLSYSLIRIIFLIW